MGRLTGKKQDVLFTVSDTQWARIAVVQLVANHLPSITEALECGLTTYNLTSHAKSEANGLKNYHQTFDAIVLITVWVKVEQCIEKRNLILILISLDIEAANINSLREEMSHIHNEWDSLVTVTSPAANPM